MRVSRALYFSALSLLVASSAWGQRDHLMCYKAGSETFAPGSVHFNDIDVTNSDCVASPASCPGEESTMGYKKVKDFCVPSTGDAESGEGNTITDSATKYIFVSGKSAGGYCTLATATACGEDADCGANGPCVLTAKYDKKASRNTSTRIRDKFEDLRADFSKEIGFLAPAKLNPGGAPVGKDTYKCYSLKATKASCDGGANDGQACKDPVVDCGGSPCAANLKFPKETDLATEGLVSFFQDDEYAGGERSYQLKKLKMFCQAAATNGVAAAAPQAGYLCYAGKQLSGPAFTVPAIQHADGAFGTNVDFAPAKADLICNPACVEPGSYAFSSHIMRITNLQIPTGNTLNTQALDIDNNPATCKPTAPAMCGGTKGDNVLSILAAGLPDLNTSLQDAVDSGSINLILEAAAFANGSTTVTAWTGDLASGSCPNSGDNNNPSLSCQYLADENFDPRVSCKNEPEATFPVTVSGLPASPALAAGGGPGTDFSFAIPFSGVELALNIHSVKVYANISHTAGVISGATGVIGGAVVLQEVKQTLADLPNALCDGGILDGGICSGTGACANGSNDGTPCDDDGTCTGGGVCESSDQATACPSGHCNWNYIGNLSKTSVVGAVDLLPRDINLDNAKTCIGGADDGEVCTSGATCDSATCDDFESTSVGISFSAIDADVVGIQ